MFVFSLFKSPNGAIQDLSKAKTAAKSIRVSCNEWNKFYPNMLLGEANIINEFKEGGLIPGIYILGIAKMSCERYKNMLLGKTLEYDVISYLRKNRDNSAEILEKVIIIKTT